MNEIKYELVKNELDFYKFQLNLILNSGKNGVIFKDSQLTLLAYFVKDGVKLGKKKALEDQIYLSMYTINNMLSDWRKVGLILGSGEDCRLNEDIQVLKTDTQIVINLKKDV
jgi:hypothetical protein